jgi:hypothetical protein
VGRRNRNGAIHGESDQREGGPTSKSLLVIRQDGKYFWKLDYIKWTIIWANDISLADIFVSVNEAVELINIYGPDYGFFAERCEIVNIETLEVIQRALPEKLLTPDKILDIIEEEFKGKTS